MLKGITPPHSPELPRLPCETDRAAEVVRADADFTAESLGRGRTELHLPGVSRREAGAGVLSVFALDDFVEPSVAYMQVGASLAEDSHP